MKIAVFATVAIVATLAVCTWSIERAIAINAVSERTVEGIGYRLDEIETRVETIEKNTCSMDKHLMSAGEQLADLARKC